MLGPPTHSCGSSTISDHVEADSGHPLLRPVKRGLAKSDWHGKDYMKLFACVREGDNSVVLMSKN